jgi:hypothetical protein
MTSHSQQEFLRDAKRQLAPAYPKLTWDRFAALVGIEPRALKTYRMPNGSSDFRLMPKLVKAAVENLITAAAAPPSRPSDDHVATENSVESLLPAALAALVMRQASQVILRQRPISGVLRQVGDQVGLDREDLQAMALVSRARLREGRSDIGAEIHDLLFYCTKPLGSWLPLPEIYAERLANVVLLDAEEGVPTREAEELSRRFVSATASLEELLFSRFHELLAKTSRVAANIHYSRVREFVVRHPIVTSDDLASLTSDLPSFIGVLITQQFYEPIPEGWGTDNQLKQCWHCGNAMRKTPAGESCRTHACAESLPAKSNKVVAVEKSLRLTRGIRQYWQEPGFDEIRLFDELDAAGLKPTLYPHLDRVDIEVGEVGIDLKAYVSPELLVSRLKRSIGGLAHYQQKWLVIPDRLIRRIPAYLERIFEPLGQVGVRVLATSSVLKELRRA